jgi:hypothetical protein
MPLIEDVDPSALRLGSARDLGAMTVIPIEGASKYQLVGKDRLGEILCLWEPSVFKGDGTEARKTIVFEIPSDVQQKVEQIEEAIRKSLQLSSRVAWHTSLKEGTMRAKIRMTAPKACAYFSVNGEPVHQPEAWRHLEVIPVLEMRSVYKQPTMAGIVWECVALMVGERRKDDVVLDYEFV